MKQYFTSLLLALILLPVPALAQEPDPIPEATAEKTPIQPASSLRPAPLNRALMPVDGTKQLQLQLVNCVNPIDCWLAQMLLPQSTFTTSRQLQFLNATDNPVKVIDTKIVSEGRLTGYQLTNQQLTIPPTAIVNPDQITDIPLTLNRSNLPPDQYPGSVYLFLENQMEPAVLPINISVRSGPLLPLAILIWGILLGRLLKYMQERGEPQAKVLQEINELEYELRVLDPKDQEILTKVIVQARNAAYREQLETARAKIKTTRDRLDVLTDLRTLENNLEKRVEAIPDATVGQAIETVQTAREAVVMAKDETAKANIQEVQELLTNTGARGVNAAQTLTSIKKVLDGFTALAANPVTPDSDDSSNFWHWFQRALLITSGISDRAKAEATFWVVRPLLALVLLAGLSAVGLGSLYVEKGTTFGARPFSDYLGLILWGLSADVASRSLSSLSERSMKKPE